MAEIKEDFRPLTHSEIMELKPLRVKIDNLMYECDLMDINNLSKFWANKDYITTMWEQWAGKSSESDGTDLIQIQSILLLCHYSMIRLLYDICKKPKGFFKRRKYKKQFFAMLKDDVSKLFDLLEKVAVFNSRLFFLLQRLRNLSMVQQSPYLKTGIELCSLEFQDGKPILNSPRRESLRKSEPSESLRK